MVDVSYVGAGSMGKAPSWPAGTRVGDLALRFTVGSQASLKGWVSASSDTSMAVATRTLTAADLDASPAVSDNDSVVVVFRGALGVGRSSQGRFGSISVAAGGAAFFAFTARRWQDTSDYSVVGVTPVATHMTGKERLFQYFGCAGYSLVPAAATVTAKTNWVGVFRSEQGLSLEITPLPGPYPPTLLTPSAGADTRADALSLVWRHQPPVVGGVQDGAEVQLRSSGGEWQYVTAAGSLTSAVTTLDTSTQLLAVTASLTLNGLYEWRVRTRQATEWSEWSGVQSFTPTTAPVAVVTAPAGTVTDNLRPVVSWTRTLGKGVQTGFEVTITGPGVQYSSGQISGNDSSLQTPVQAFQRGGSYTFAVRVRQTGGLWSAAAAVTRQVTWTPPPTPVVYGYDVAPGVRVEVITAPDTRFQVERLDGDIWVEVGSGITPATGRTPGHAYFADVLASYGKSLYRARSYKVLDGMDLTSDWSDPAEVPCTDTNAYLVLDSDRSQWLEVDLVEDSGRQIVRAGAVHYPLTADHPTVDYGPVQGLEGTLGLRTWSEAETEMLANLLLTNAPLIFRYPPDEGVGLRYQRLALKPDSLPTERAHQQDLGVRVTTFGWVSQ